METGLPRYTIKFWPRHFIRVKEDPKGLWVAAHDANARIAELEAELDDSQKMANSIIGDYDKRIAELKAQLAEQKEWVKDLADLNVKNEAAIADRDKRLADIPKDVLRCIQVGGDTAELIHIVGGLDAALSDPVSRENGDTPDREEPCK